MKKTIYIFLTLFTILYTHYSFSQNNEVDSLKALLKTAKNDSNKVKILCNLDWYLAEEGNFAEAIRFGNEAVILAKKISFARGLIDAYSYLARTYQYKSDYTTALNYFLEEQKLYEAYPHKKGLGTNFTNIGNVYADKGDYPRALEYYFKALPLFEKSSKEGLASVYNDLGIVYSYQGNLPKTLEYFLKALRINEELNRKKGIVNCLGNIGNVYYFMHNYSKALEYQFKATRLNEEIGNKSGLSDNYGNIAIIYNDQPDADYIKQGLKTSERFTLSMKYSEQALRLNEEIGSKYGMAVNFINIGSAHFHEKNYRQAFQYAEKGFRLAKENGFPELVKESAQKLSEMYQQTRNEKKALEYYKVYIAARDTLLNEANTKKTVQAEMNYDFDKKEAAAKLEQEKKEAISQAESRKQKMVLLLVCSVLLLVAIFAVFAYRSYLQKQKANEAITLQKHIIEEKQKEILDSIYYARRIQRALLPSEKYIAKNLYRF